MRQTTKPKETQQAGGVALEFLVSLPMFGLFFCGLIMLGSSLKVLSMAHQSAYNAALYAAGYDESASSSTDPAALGRSLFIAATPSMFLGERQDFAVDYEDSDANGTSDLVTVGYSGDVRSLGLLGFLQQTPVRASVSLPLLGSFNAAQNVSPQFQNAAQIYCANGQVALNNNPDSCPPFVQIVKGCEKMPEYCKEMMLADDMPVM